MPSLTTYDPETGDLLHVRSGPVLEDLVALTDGKPFVEGAWSPRFYRVDTETGAVVEK